MGKHLCGKNSWHCWIQFTGIPPNQYSKNDFSLNSRRYMTRKAFWFVVSLFMFDSLSEYPTKNCRGYSDKPPNCKDILSDFLFSSVKNTRNIEKFPKSSHFSGYQYFCRGPPDCRCFRHSTSTITGGNHVKQEQ